MYIITKETAEAYRQQIAKPERPAETEPLLPGIDGVAATGSQPISAKPAQGPVGQKSGSSATQLPLELTWSGEVPSQKWMNFYTKFLTKLGIGNDLSLNVNVKCKPQGGLSPQKVEEIKSALRELGLDDTLN